MLIGGAKPNARVEPSARIQPKRLEQKAADAQPPAPPGEIELALIEADPDQPRKHFDEAALQELAESIQDVGVLQAITVRAHPKKTGRYIIIAGERRYRAAKLAGQTSIPAVVSAPANHKLKLREIQIIENIHREELAPMEIAEYMRQKLIEGMKKGDIAALIRKSPAFVSRHLSLINLPSVLQELFDSGRCTEVSVIYDLRVLHKQAPEKVAEWLRKVKADITRSAVDQLRALIAAGKDVQDQDNDSSPEEPTSAMPEQPRGMKQIDTARSDHLSKVLGTRVQVDSVQIRIAYLNPEELARIEQIIVAGSDRTDTSSPSDPS
jgi:ParB family chromosome partitioning protein